MTREDKELLLKDLCARLPYGVKIQYDIYGIQDLTINELNACIKGVKNIKPYLRPMSSMTEEEYDEMFQQFYSAQEEFFRNCSNTDTIGKTIAYDWVRYDWLNKNKFDYRGLIPRGCAIAVTEDNNPYAED